MHRQTKQAEQRQQNPAAFLSIFIASGQVFAAAVAFFAAGVCLTVSFAASFVAGPMGSVACCLSFAARAVIAAAGQAFSAALPGSFAAFWQTIAGEAMAIAAGDGVFVGVAKNTRVLFHPT